MKSRRIFFGVLASTLSFALIAPGIAVAAPSGDWGPDSETTLSALIIDGSEKELATAEKELLSVVPSSDLSVPADNELTTLPNSDDPAIELDGVTIEVVGADLEHFASIGDNTAVASSDDSDFVFRGNAEGVQMMFSIENEDSPHETSFKVSEGNAFISAETLGADTGEVFVMDSEGNIHSSIDAPWAYDAEGKTVKTYFEVSAGTLTQVVVPDAETTYPIVADPNWGKIATCVGTIVGNAALYIVPGGIVGRLLAKGHSIKKAAEILVRTLKAKSYNDKLKALRNLGLQLGANLTGFGAIVAACG